jgi:ubiquinone/menaquinone biosynthesis C-methylase UbiE
MRNKFRRENKENINLWEFLGKDDPFWGVLTNPKKKNNLWGKSEFYETGSKDITILLRELRDNNSISYIKNVLDFGCGVGRLTKHISPNFTNIVAIDISKGMLLNATRNNKVLKNTLFIQCSYEGIPFIKKNTIDLIVSIITFQHIHEQIQLEYLKDFSRILNKNGLIYIQLVHGFKKNIKGFLLKTLGNRGLSIFHKLKYKLNYPMKIYIFEENIFKKAIAENNIEIIKRTNSNATGSAFRSYTYLLRVTK